mmetsp:Transcript_16071/g.34821  ORF Transcript_16071/g.34821 Transcript_16071/m.34821 type:complete len:228 (+) Transcript_16071:155-838(+)
MWRHFPNHAGTFSTLLSPFTLNSSLLLLSLTSLRTQHSLTHASSSAALFRRVSRLLPLLSQRLDSCSSCLFSNRTSSKTAKKSRGVQAVRLSSESSTTNPTSATTSTVLHRLHPPPAKSPHSSPKKSPSIDTSRTLARAVFLVPLPRDEIYNAFTAPTAYSHRFRASWSRRNVLFSSSTPCVLNALKCTTHSPTSGASFSTLKTSSFVYDTWFIYSTSSRRHLLRSD